MNVIVKMPRKLLDDVHQDLSRPHSFTLERVGFLSGRVGQWDGEGLVVLLHAYHLVADEDYEENNTVGAMMASSAIRKAMQFAYRNQVAMFHVHRHDHRGRPMFSRVDLQENAKFIPDFWHVCSSHPHGALLLSLDSMSGLCWCPSIAKPVPITEVVIVGAPMEVFTHGQ